MKSYWLIKIGDHAELEPREMPVPQPASGQMLVRMRASSINRGDIMARIHRHSAAGGRPAGIDGSGDVVSVGAAVTHFKKGERVLFRARGCYADYAVVDAALAARVPERLSWEQAAALPAAYITAWEAVVEFGRARAGEWVLLLGASSGVGVAALQIAKTLGARVIGVSGSASKLAALKALGLDVGAASLRLCHALRVSTSPCALQGQGAPSRKATGVASRNARVAIIFIAAYARITWATGLKHHELRRYRWPYFKKCSR